MINVYVDTSLVLSPFRVSDDNFEFMKVISSHKHIQIVTGTLTIVEITSVLLREEEMFNKAIYRLSEEESLKEISLLSLQMQIRLAINFLINYYQIKILEDDKPEESNIVPSGILTNPIFKLLINSTTKSKLRTLDLLHYYTARYNSDIKNFSIKYLITSDYVFQKMRDIFTDVSKVLIISPETFIERESENY
ncbi:MAG: PIN domain-containing protein [Candidatus Hodarchaeales archaeon]|jgi:predicted nucleic acid-binding protein